ncbi:hypothetical protein [uncultured Winogradskyella sp.]|uniref:hypothetical protein n=1 Tax=Winogradskyella sp. 4-2091 TaxID=3381659 RepID=UPI002620ACFB|nr:hypothetical protein [uncultured Winogradskyella sp.]
MKSSVRNAIIIVLSLVLVPVLFFKSCVIQNPKPSECKVVTAKIIELRAGPTFDIGFTGDQGERFYINRGIESGLNLDSLNAKVLNKTVTLHLPILLYGPTRHIAQLEIDGQILYSEFKN